MQRFELYDDNGDPIAGMAPQLTDADLAEWGKMSRFTPAPADAQQQPWWQNLVSYGISKAIDNTFPNERHGIQGNTGPGSFAGQNGQSYQQRGSQNAPPAPAGASLGSMFAGLTPTTLIVIAAAAYFLMKR